MDTIKGEHMEHTQYEKNILCPNEGSHEATLYLYGHELAGIWECSVCQVSDVCSHDNSHVEYDESWPQSPFGLIFSIPYLVCDTCGCDTGDDIQDHHLIEQECEV